MEEGEVGSLLTLADDFIDRNAGDVRHVAENDENDEAREKGSGAIDERDEDWYSAKPKAQLKTGFAASSIFFHFLKNIFKC